MIGDEQLHPQIHPSGCRDRGGRYLARSSQHDPGLQYGDSRRRYSSHGCDLVQHRRNFGGLRHRVRAPFRHDHVPARSQGVKLLLGAVLSVLASLSPGTALAQSSAESFDLGNGRQGQILFAAISGRPGDRLPTRVLWSNPIQTPSAQMFVTIFKVSNWDNNTFFTITPEAIWESPIFPDSSEPRNVEVLNEFTQAMASRTGLQRLGRFRLVVTAARSGMPNLVYNWDFQITADTSYAAAAQGGASSGGGSGGGSTGGGTSPSPGDTPGFWESLFVPDQQCWDNFLRAINRMQSWGPFGIWAGITQRTQAASGNSTALAQNYLLPLGNMMGTPLVLDLNPMAGFIRFMRTLFAGLLWWMAITYIAQRVSKAV